MKFQDDPEEEDAGPSVSEPTTTAVCLQYGGAGGRTDRWTDGRSVVAWSPPDARMPLRHVASVPTCWQDTSCMAVAYKSSMLLARRMHTCFCMAGYVFAA